MGVERIECAAGGAGGRGNRTEQSENHAEQLLVAQLVALVSRLNKIVEEVGAQTRTTLGDDGVNKIGRTPGRALAFRRVRLTRLDRGGERQHVLVVEQDLAPLLVQAHHGRHQRAEHELGAILSHRVERRSLPLDIVEHGFDDVGDARLDLRHAARGECRHQKPAQPRMLLTVHLGEEREAHEFVILPVTRPFGQLRRKPFGVREDLMNVGVAPDDHLRRAIAENIERWLSRPAGDEAVRILSEFRAAEVESNDLAAVGNAEQVLLPHRQLPTADVEIVRLKPLLWKWVGRDYRNDAVCIGTAAMRSIGTTWFSAIRICSCLSTRSASTAVVDGSATTSRSSA